MNTQKTAKNLLALGLALVVIGFMVSFVGGRWLLHKQQAYNQNIFESLNREVSGDTGQLRQAAQKLAGFKKLMTVGGFVFLLVGGALWVGGWNRNGDLSKPLS